MAGITREQVTKLHKENKRNRLLDEMLQVLAEKKTSDDIQRQQMAIYKEFGEELHAQFDAYFAGPKGSTDKSIFEWISKCYVAARLFTSSDFLYLNPVGGLKRVEGRLHQPARMVRLFFETHNPNEICWGSDDPEVISENNYKTWQPQNLKRAREEYGTALGQKDEKEAYKQIKDDVKKVTENAVKMTFDPKEVTVSGIIPPKNVKEAAAKTKAEPAKKPAKKADPAKTEAKAAPRKKVVMTPVSALASASEDYANIADVLGENVTAINFDVAVQNLDSLGGKSFISPIENENLMLQFGRKEQVTVKDGKMEVGFANDVKFITGDTANGSLQQWDHWADDIKENFERIYKAPGMTEFIEGNYNAGEDFSNILAQLKNVVKTNAKKDLHVRVHHPEVVKGRSVVELEYDDIVLNESAARARRGEIAKLAEMTSKYMSRPVSEIKAMNPEERIKWEICARLNAVANSDRVKVYAPVKDDFKAMTDELKGLASIINRPMTADNALIAVSADIDRTANTTGLDPAAIRDILSAAAAAVQNKENEGAYLGKLNAAAATLKDAKSLDDLLALKDKYCDMLPENKNKLIGKFAQKLASAMELGVALELNQFKDYDDLNAAYLSAYAANSAALDAALAGYRNKIFRNDMLADVEKKVKASAGFIEKPLSNADKIELTLPVMGLELKENPHYAQVIEQSSKNKVASEELRANIEGLSIEFGLKRQMLFQFVGNYLDDNEFARAYERAMDSPEICKVLVRNVAESAKRLRENESELKQQGVFNEERRNLRDQLGSIEQMAADYLDSETGKYREMLKEELTDEQLAEKWPELDSVLGCYEMLYTKSEYNMNPEESDRTIDGFIKQYHQLSNRMKKLADPSFKPEEIKAEEPEKKPEVKAEAAPEAEQPAAPAKTEKEPEFHFNITSRAHFENRVYHLNNLLKDYVKGEEMITANGIGYVGGEFLDILHASVVYPDELGLDFFPNTIAQMYFTASKLLGKPFTDRVDEAMKHTDWARKLTEYRTNELEYASYGHPDHELNERLRSTLEMSLDYSKPSGNQVDTLVNRYVQTERRDPETDKLIKQYPETVSSFIKKSVGHIYTEINKDPDESPDFTELEPGEDKKSVELQKEKIREQTMGWAVNRYSELLDFCADVELSPKQNKSITDLLTGIERTYGEKFSKEIRNRGFWYGEDQTKPFGVKFNEKRLNIADPHTLSAELEGLKNDLKATDPFWMLTNTDLFDTLKSDLDAAINAVNANDGTDKARTQMLGKLEALADTAEKYSIKKQADYTGSKKDRDLQRGTAAAKIQAFTKAFLSKNGLRLASASEDTQTKELKPAVSAYEEIKLENENTDLKRAAVFNPTHNQKLMIQLYEERLVGQEERYEYKKLVAEIAQNAKEIEKLNEEIKKGGPEEKLRGDIDALKKSSEDTFKSIEKRGTEYLEKNAEAFNKNLAKTSYDELLKKWPKYELAMRCYKEMLSDKAAENHDIKAILGRYDTMQTRINERAGIEYSRTQDVRPVVPGRGESASKLSVMGQLAEDALGEAAQMKNPEGNLLKTLNAVGASDAQKMFVKLGTTDFIKNEKDSRSVDNAVKSLAGVKSKAAAKKVLNGIFVTVSNNLYTQAQSSYEALSKNMTDEQLIKAWPKMDLLMSCYKEAFAGTPLGNTKDPQLQNPITNIIRTHDALKERMNKLAGIEAKNDPAETSAKKTGAQAVKS